MLNKVILMGRLTDNPDYRQTPTGTSVASFRLAVERNYQKSGEERKADFISIITWRNTADFVNRYFVKGQLVAVEGSLQTRDYTDKDGVKHYVTEVIADQVYFAEGKRNNNNSNDDTTNFATNNIGITALTPEFENTDDLPF